MNLLIVEMGVPPDTVRLACGSHADWFLRALEARAGIFPRVIRPYLGEMLPEPADIAGALITGSWSMVTEHLPWSEATADWIKKAMGVKLPLFGVCYGHQLMAYALGGRVGNNPNGAEIGCFSVTLTAEGKKDELTAACPESFSAYLFHRQSVLAPPEGAVILAKSEQDPCQILRYGENACSVQFHPEFTAAILRHACQDHGGSLLADMHHVQPETPWAERLLLDFFREER
ncbi:glutamine amidotransferase [Oxalobacter sp. OttesenSCG-928-P03]|nr:glutamine amidotransferase [Oxalobacter sp. OttesenSCG-928-P03]